MAGNTLGTQVSRGATVTHHTGMDAILTGDQRSSGRQAGSIGAVVLIEAYAFSGDAVDIRCGVPTIAIAAHVVGSQSVDIEDNYSHD